MTATTIPGQTTIAHKAAFILFKDGAMSRRDLMDKLQAKTKNYSTHVALDVAIDNGWLIEDTRCNLDIGKRAFNYFSGTEEDPEPAPYIGTPAESRSIDMMSRPPISRKYLTNSHGTRADIPDWSQRDRPSFATVS